MLAAVELADDPGTTVLLAGGLVRPGELSLIGTEAIDAYRNFIVMGVAGVHEERGFTDYHRDESAVKRAAIAASDRLIVVADHSKLGRSHLSNIAPLSAAAILVTDGAADSAAVVTAHAAGATVISGV